MSGDKNKKPQGERSNDKVEELQQKITDRDAQSVKGGKASSYKQEKK